MKLKLPLIAALVAALGLSACGGSDNSPPPTPTPPPPVVTPITNPATSVFKDIVIGTGAEAAVGKTISVHYTGWLYDSTKPDNKGARFDTSAGAPPVSFVLAKGNLIEGWVQGVPGMKVGGKRTLSFPASLGYGAAGRDAIPGNAGLVFDIELISVK